MECIDLKKGLLSEEEVQDRITSFGDYDMSSEEADNFLEHITECKSCHKETLAYADMITNIKIHATYKRLVAAKENENWEEVLALGNEMVFRGYSEEVYPIKNMVREAKLRGVSVFSEYHKVNLSYIGKKLTGTLVAGYDLILMLFDKIELKKTFPTDILIGGGDFSWNATYPEKQEPSIIEETDNFIVKVFKGELHAHFTIEAKL